MTMPPIDKTFVGTMKDWLMRLTIVERRLAISGGGGGTSAVGPGMIAPFAGGVVPSGWLLCNGAAVSRSTYADLFNAIGTSYGTGDGSTTFNLPDLRSRVPVGKGPDAEFDTLGETGGAKTHSHTISSVAATAWAMLAWAAAGRVRMRRDNSGIMWDANVMSTSATAVPITTDTEADGDLSVRVNGGTDEASSLQPYQVVNYIISIGSGAGAGGAFLLPPRLEASNGTILLTNTNDAVENGWYRFNTSTTNIPINTGSGSLFVSVGGSAATSVRQLARRNFTESSGEPDMRAWERTSNDGGTTWSTWKEIGSGYGLVQTVYFTSSGSFTKASYTGLRAVRVKVQAAGGGGGGAPTAASGQNAYGTGGGGGGYAEAFILTDTLASSVTVTVGASGTGGAGDGGTGGNSSFGSLVVANGGGGGITKPSSTLGGYQPGGLGGSGATGDLLTSGGGGTSGWGAATLAAGGAGGAAMMGGGGRSVSSGAGGGASAGDPGGNYGGGGGGAFTNSTGTARNGGAGGPGIVIVEIYR